LTKSLSINKFTKLKGST